jgi:hypothetical protein
MQPVLPRKSLKMIWKLQASANQVHVNLSEGSVVWRQTSEKQAHVNLSEGSAPQVLENDREAASLCKASICKFIRGMQKKGCLNSLFTW